MSEKTKQTTKQPNKKVIMLQTTQGRLNTLITSKLEAMPKGFNQTRFLQNCMTVLSETKGIENCTPESVARTMLKGAFLGLDFFQKECYAIAYGNEVNFQTDYKGEIKLAKKYSIRPIKTIYAKVVKEGDEYEEGIIDGVQYVNFKPKAFNNNQIIGAFAVVIFTDGEMLIESMSTEEIDKIRNDFSKMKNGLMWTKTPSEAYKKTVIRRLTKLIEKDFVTQEAQDAFDDGGDSEFKNENAQKVVNPFEDVVDVEFETVKEEVEEEKTEVAEETLQEDMPEFLQD